MICQAMSNCAADRLRDPEHDAADQRTPQAAEPAEHDHLEGDQKPGRTGSGIEIAPDRHEAGGDANRHERDAHRHRINARRGQADEIGRGHIVRHRADLGADAAAVKHQVEADDDRTAATKVMT